MIHSKKHLKETDLQEEVSGVDPQSGIKRMIRILNNIKVIRDDKI